ncbi:hypothetical protein [Chitinimonas sp. BJYL2]|uniref:hypothetical protein n=1 Tax=Chitinimonas sp. BJYL2 TaxID=2976696 RepID=UPI0022B526E4|nr:hypothetical protein [Chitinimonas sp. BJYL2]
MTTSNEQAAKLPLVKRIVLMVRTGGAVPILMGVLLLLLIVGIGAGGFLGGLALATKRNQTVEQNLLAQTKAARAAETKALAEKDVAEKELDQVKTTLAAQVRDIEQLKELLERARIERETMDKVLGEVRDSLAAGGASPKVQQAVKGAMLKFGEKECELPDRAVSSKADIRCLDLKNAIESMNSMPGGYGSKPAETKTPAVKPGDKPAEKPKSGH